MTTETETTPRERNYAKQEPGQRRTLDGIVTGTKMSKTLIVKIERVEQHKKYLKYIRRHSKLYAHDEKEIAKVGDHVRVIECRPHSKLKRFALLEVVTAGLKS
jgi:small subunit ribosomal protein S17